MHIAKYLLFAQHQCVWCTTHSIPCNTLHQVSGISWATHCNTRQLTATHCNTLQHTTTHTNTSVAQGSTSSATHCNILHHISWSHHTSSTCILGLVFKTAGPFGSDILLFWGDIGLFCGDLGLFGTSTRWHTNSLTHHTSSICITGLSWKKRKRAVESVHASINTDKSVSLHLHRDLQTRDFWNPKSWVSTNMHKIWKSRVWLRIKVQNEALLQRYGALFHFTNFSDPKKFPTYTYTYTQYIKNMHTHLQTFHHFSPRCIMGLCCGDVGLFCRYSFIRTHVSRLDVYKDFRIYTVYRHDIIKTTWIHTYHIYIYIYVYVNIHLWMRRFLHERTRCENSRR